MYIHNERSKTEWGLIPVEVFKAYYNVYNIGIAKIASYIMREASQRVTN